MRIASKSGPLARHAQGVAASRTPPIAPVHNDARPLIASPFGHDFGQIRIQRQEAPDTKPAATCPVTSTGTLSEVSWGETSGIYPTEQNKFSPDKWDAAKTCELLKARGAVHAVGQRGERVHKAKPKADDPIEQKLKVYHLTENFPALDSTISDTEVKWFYLSPDSATPEHPGATNSVRVQSYGSFYNIGGGDVARGPVYLHFYKLKPAEKKK